MHARLGGSQAGWDRRHKGKRALAQAEAVKEGRQAHVSSACLSAERQLPDIVLDLLEDWCLADRCERKTM